MLFDSNNLWQRELEEIAKLDSGYILVMVVTRAACCIKLLFS